MLHTFRDGVDALSAPIKKYYTGTNTQRQAEYGSKQNKYVFVYTEPDGAPNWSPSLRAPGPVGPASITHDKDRCHLCVWCVGRRHPPNIAFITNRFLGWSAEPRLGGDV